MIEEVIIAALWYTLAGYFSAASANKILNKDLGDEGAHPHLIPTAWQISATSAFFQGSADALKPVAIIGIVTELPSGEPCLVGEKSLLECVCVSEWVCICTDGLSKKHVAVVVLWGHLLTNQLSGERVTSLKQIILE